MGLLDNYTGIGDAPRPEWEHQNCIKKLLRFIEIECDKTALPETTISPNDLSGLAPDVIILDAEPDADDLAAPVIAFIEVTNTKMMRAIKAKCEQLCMSSGIATCFVYDYERAEWHKYTKKHWTIGDSSFMDEELSEAF